MDLKNLKIIVTGAASGMGAHFVRRLHEAGAVVAAGDVNEAGLSELDPAIHKRRLDVSDENDCSSFVQWAHERMHGLNALVNNAGILRDALLIKKDKNSGQIIKALTEDWNSVLAVNLSGATFMAREVAAKIGETATRPGVIVNMSSIARHGNRGQTSYAATKAALAANTVTWARDLASFGIRVGAVAPGMIETPMTRGMKQNARDVLVSSIPVGRIGEPQDIWIAVKFVLECDYFNGRTIDVDGGLSM